MIIDSIKAAAKKMKIDYDDLTSQINHKGERGNSREEIFSSYLRKYFPQKYEFSKGMIIDVNGHQSKQQDLIIYDAFSSPIMMNMESIKIVPIESVYTTIEIKSSLNKARLLECVENIQSVRSLPKYPITNFVSSTAGFVFSFTSDTSLDTLLDNLVEFNTQVNPEHQISVVCVLDKGLIVNLEKHGLSKLQILPSESTTRAIINNQIENNLILFYLILMQHLNSTLISPPDLFKYVEKEQITKVQYSIPQKHFPTDGTYEFDGRQIDMGNVSELIKDMERFKHIQSMKASSRDIMEYFSDNFDRLMKMADVREESIFNFFGKDYTVGRLRRLFNTYNRIRNREEVTKVEKNFCKQGEQELYEQYRGSV